MEEITISSVIKEDEVKVMEHLHGAFAIDEPLHQYFNDGPTEEEDEIFRDLFTHNISLKATNPAGDIVGVLLCKTFNKSQFFSFTRIRITNTNTYRYMHYQKKKA